MLCTWTSLETAVVLQVVKKLFEGLCTTNELNELDALIYYITFCFQTMVALRD